MNLALLPFLLLAGMGGPPPEPAYQLATATRHAYRLIDITAMMLLDILDTLADGEE